MSVTTPEIKNSYAPGLVKNIPISNKLLCILDLPAYRYYGNISAPIPRVGTAYYPTIAIVGRKYRKIYPSLMPLLPNSPSVVGDITLMAMGITSTANTTTRSIIKCGQNATAESLSIRLTGDVLTGYAYSAATIGGSIALGDNVPYVAFLVYRYGQSIKLYINGVEDSNSVITGFSTLAKAYFGTGAPADCFLGLNAIWSRALNANEIAKITHNPSIILASKQRQINFDIAAAIAARRRIIIT